jgi:hypothetical protein
MPVVFRIKGLHFYLSSPSINSAGRCPSSKQQESVNTWDEIDRRNEHVLHPLNSKNSFQSQNHFSIYHHQFSRNSNKSFYLNSYHSYRQRRRSSQTDDQVYLSPSIYVKKYTNKRSSLAPMNNDSSFLYGNSIVRSNKADVINVFDQQFINCGNTSSYVNKYGVIIDENGPFWPETYSILHPTPKLLRRESTSKEFYLSALMSSKRKKKKLKL